MAIKYITLANGIPYAKDESSAYDETTVIGEPISSGTTLTLPNGGTYTSAELEIYLNNVRLESVEDYNYVGAVPRTQVSFTFDLIVSDIIRWRKDLV